MTVWWKRKGGGGGGKTTGGCCCCCCCRCCCFGGGGRGKRRDQERRQFFPHQGVNAPAGACLLIVGVVGGRGMAGLIESVKREQGMYTATSFFPQGENNTLSHTHEKYDNKKRRGRAWALCCRCRRHPSGEAVVAGPLVRPAKLLRSVCVWGGGGGDGGLVIQAGQARLSLSLISFNLFGIIITMGGRHRHPTLFLILMIIFIILTMVGDSRHCSASYPLDCSAPSQRRQEAECSKP